MPFAGLLAMYVVLVGALALVVYRRIEARHKRRTLMFAQLHDDPRPPARIRVLPR
jgi:hypothetical protein